METILIILSIALALMGIIGGIVPVIPGPILSAVAMFVLQFSQNHQFETFTLVIWSVFALLITLLDYLVPAATTKKFGGSKKGSLGSLIGLFVGIFFPPISLVIGAYLGAIVGEIMAGKNFESANKSALGALLGLFLGTVFKVTFSLCVLFIIMWKLIF